MQNLPDFGTQRANARSFVSAAAAVRRESRRDAQRRVDE
jgi:hypothetical protein